MNRGIIQGILAVLAVLAYVAGKLFVVFVSSELRADELKVTAVSMAFDAVTALLAWAAYSVGDL